MARIFINYRRDDSQGVAGRLFDYLASKYSRRELFMDVDAMQPGLDFAKQLDTQVAQCHVLLAVIGPHWLAAHDQAGHRRLDSEKDSVRVELASALKRDIAVIPVLVDGAVMPSEENLSEDLKPLARRHALELRHTRFNADADAIMHALEAVVPRSRVPWRLVGAGVAALIVLAALAVTWSKFAAKTRPSAPAEIAISGKPAPAITPPAPAITPPSATAPLPASTPAPKPTPPSSSAIPAAPIALPPAQPAPSAVANPMAGVPAGVKLGELMHGIILQGSNLRMVEIDRDDPANCQVVCRGDSSCAAWTYIPPRAAGQSGRCMLKAVIPEPFPNSCCTSGVEHAPDPQFREPPLVPADVAGALRGIDLFGGEYRAFTGAQATVEACQAACKAESPCLAWVYVRPGVMGSDQRCVLKSKTPTPVHSTCCISGTERQASAGAATAPVTTPPAPSPGKPLLQNTNLIGSDYRNFVLSAADPTMCQNACKAETQCLSWTYVHPGMQGPNARCWLKSAVPPPTMNSCCTSGVERPEAK